MAREMRSLSLRVGWAIFGVLVGILEVWKAILGAWKAISAGFCGHHGLAGGHLVDLGGHHVATRAAKSLDIDFPMDVARLFVGGYPVQVISEGFLGGLGGSSFGSWLAFWRFGKPSCGLRSHLGKFLGVSWACWWSSCRFWLT